MYVDRKEHLSQCEPLPIELAEFWRFIEEDAVDRLLALPHGPSREFWEERFKAAYANCNELGIPESHLKACTTHHFWKDLVHLAYDELRWVNDKSKRAYWTSVLAYAHSEMLSKGKPRSSSETLD